MAPITRADPSYESQKYRDFLQKQLAALIARPGNLSATEYWYDQYARLNLALLIKGKHPFIRGGGVPSPMPCDVKNGWGFTGSAAMTLELASIADGYSSRSYISMDELNRMGLGKFGAGYTTVCIQNKHRASTVDEKRAYGSVSTMKFLNIEALKKEKRLAHMFDTLFPEFSSEQSKWSTYVSKQKSKYVENRKRPEINTVTQQSIAETSSTLLPRFTQECKNYELCRNTGRPFVPMYSEEEHLKEIAVAFQKNPKEVIRAFSESSYVADKFINKVFSNELVAGNDSTITSSLGITKAQDVRTSRYISENDNKELKRFESLAIGERGRTKSKSQSIGR